jgi:hypothetical protein
MIVTFRDNRDKSHPKVNQHIFNRAGKFEYRMTKIQNKFGTFEFRILRLFRISNFVLRIFRLLFHLPPLLLLH